MVIFPVDLGFPYNLLNIPTNPHNMVIFPVGFPYNLQRAKFPYCRGIPLRVATLALTAARSSDLTSLPLGGATVLPTGRLQPRLALAETTGTTVYCLARPLAARIFHDRLNT